MTKAARLDNAAIVAGLAAPAGFLLIVVLVFTLHLPAGLGAGLFWSPFALGFACAAIRLPLAGGALLLISGGLLFTCSLATDHYIMYYVPISCIQFFAGILHVARSLK